MNGQFSLRGYIDTQHVYEANWMFDVLVFKAFDFEWKIDKRNVSRYHQIVEEEIC